MKIRNAKIQDVKQIHDLVSVYAEMDRMLFRSYSELYENIQSFLVAADDGNILGCCSLQVIWEDLAEIKSLAVASDRKQKGIGKNLVNSAIEKARQLGLKKVFALTLEPEFFKKIGFEKIDKSQLPMKVWSDCAKCPKQDHCDEIAFIKYLD